MSLTQFDPGKGSRSEHVYHVVAAMVEMGFTDEEIEDVMISHPYGVGAKYREKGARGHDYIQFPIKEARRRDAS